MDPSTAAGAGAGFGLLLALMNGWLASRRNRSALRWFIASLVLSPVALLLTIYLLAQPRSTAGGDRCVGLAAVAVWALLVIILLAVLFAWPVSFVGSHTGTGMALPGLRMTLPSAERGDGHDIRSPTVWVDQIGMARP